MQSGAATLTVYPGSVVPSKQASSSPSRPSIASQDKASRSVPATMNPYPSGPAVNNFESRIVFSYGREIRSHQHIANLQVKPDTSSLNRAPAQFMSIAREQTDKHSHPGVGINRETRNQWRHQAATSDNRRRRRSRPRPPPRRIAPVQSPYRPPAGWQGH